MQRILDVSDDEIEEPTPMAPAVKKAVDLNRFRHQPNPQPMHAQPNLHPISTSSGSDYENKPQLVTTNPRDKRKVPSSPLANRDVDAMVRAKAKPPAILHLEDDLDDAGGSIEKKKKPAKVQRPRIDDSDDEPEIVIEKQGGRTAPRRPPPPPPPSRRPSRAAESSEEEEAANSMSDSDENDSALDPEENEEQEAEMSKKQIRELISKARNISKSLRDSLGNTTGEDANDGGTGGKELATRQDLLDACGPSAALLKPYQLVGVNFLSLLHRSPIVGGAMVADEMGLGKTSQVICFLGLLARQHAASATDKPRLHRPHLVLAPASLLENWSRELRQWCPALGAPILLHGAEAEASRARLDACVREQRAIRAGNGVSDEEEEDDDSSESDDDFRSSPSPAASPLSPLPPAHDFQVVLATYTAFEKDSEVSRNDRKLLNKIEWGCVVLDEAHALKNRNSMRTVRIKQLTNDKAKFRILLTGTPLQNDLVELQSLLEVMDLNLFQDGTDKSDDEGRRRKDKDGGGAAAILGAEHVAEEDRIRLAKELLAPVVLRRVKADVAKQLVSKTRRVERVNMLPLQRLMYEYALAVLRKKESASLSSQLMAATRSLADISPDEAIVVVSSDDEENGDAAPSKPRFFAGGAVSGLRLGGRDAAHSFTCLRKLAQHPLLVRHMYDDATLDLLAPICMRHEVFGPSARLPAIRDELASYSDHALSVLCATYPHFLGQWMLDPRRVLASGKMQAMLQLFTRLRAVGSRPLIFSQWTQVLDLIAAALHHEGITYVRLDGTTAVSERQQLVDKFNQDTNVFCFLLTTKAGGVGLNLTGADTVIMHDIDVNPQSDLQSEDRSHRLGQTRSVTVYRLVSQGTVDENIMAIADRKLRLGEAVLTEGKKEDDGFLRKTEQQHAKDILKQLLSN